LSCCSIGLGGGIFQENFDPTYFDTKKITELKEQFPNDILGLKIRIPRELVSDLEPLKRAIKIASDIGDMSVCVHVTNAPASMDEVAKLLRAGDIFCHVFHGRGPTILDDKGQVLEGVRDARNRGVIFDMSHGKTNFSNDVCLRAMEMGFSPDVISTDMGTNRFFKGLRVRSLPFVMSKMISFGMPLYDVVNCVSAVPAKLMKMEGMIGTLAPEARADVTIMKIEPTEAVFEDFEGKKRALDKLIVPVMTILDGQVVFAREGFSLS
jgi:predicted amidohydrolase